MHDPRGTGAEAYTHCFRREITGILFWVGIYAGGLMQPLSLGKVRKFGMPIL